MSNARHVRWAGGGVRRSAAPRGRLRRRLRRRRNGHRWGVAAAAVTGLAVGQFAGPLPGLAPLVAGTRSPPTTDPMVETGPLSDRAEPRSDTPGDGERAVALVRPSALPPLAPGDRVELVAVSVDHRGEIAIELMGEPVRVVALDDDTLTVAIAADAVGALLEHQARGPIEVVGLP